MPAWPTPYGVGAQDAPDLRLRQLLPAGAALQVRHILPAGVEPVLDEHRRGVGAGQDIQPRPRQNGRVANGGGHTFHLRQDGLGRFVPVPVALP